MRPGHGLTIDRFDEPAHADGAQAGRHAPGLSDEIGDRLLILDSSGAPSLELLRFQQALTAMPGFEVALRRRVERLRHLRHPSFATLPAVEYLGGGHSLALLSDYTPGRRLSEVLQEARGLAFATALIQELTPALVTLHQQGYGIGHGALAASRIVIAPEGRLIIIEHVLGSALERLQLTATRLRADLGIAVPPTAPSARPRLDSRTDYFQLGLIALSLLLGRRLTSDEYPENLASALDQAARTSDPQSVELFHPLRAWLERALQLNGQVFEASGDAQDALHDFPAVIAEQTAEQWRGLPEIHPQAVDRLEPSWAADPTPSLSGEQTGVPLQAVVAAEPADVVLTTPSLAAPAPDAPDAPAPDVPERSEILPEADDLELSCAADPTPSLSDEPTEVPLHASVAAEPVDVVVLTTPSLEAPAPDAPDAPAPDAPEPSEILPVGPAAALPDSEDQDQGMNQLPAVSSDEQPSSETPSPWAGQLDWPGRDDHPVVPYEWAKDVPPADESSASWPRVAAHGLGDSIDWVLNRPNRYMEGLVLALALCALGEAFVIVSLLQRRGAPAPPAGAEIHVETPDPGAAVLVDGRSAGVTPLQLKISADTRSISVVSPRPQGPKSEGAVGSTGQENLTPENRREPPPKAGVRAGDGQAAATPAPRPRGGIRLLSPIELEVFEGDTRLGSSATGIVSALSGRHELELVNSVLGFRSRQIVDVRSGQVVSVAVSPPNGRVNINALPWAEVWIDGKSAGETPIGNLPLPLGEHEIIFRHPQLGEQRRTAVVRLDGVTRISVNLQR